MELEYVRRCNILAANKRIYCQIIERYYSPYLVLPLNLIGKELQPKIWPRFIQNSNLLKPMMKGRRLNDENKAYFGYFL
jgi:hypothetical protein